MSDMDTRIQLMELRQSWTPPDGLDRSRPREVSFTGRGKALVGLAAALVIGAITAAVGLGLVASRQAAESRILRQEGVVTVGTITKLWRSRDDKKQPWMAYRFTSQGGTYRRDAKVPLPIWKNLRVGADYPVRYVPSHPDLNHPEGLAGRPLPPWVPFLVAGALAALAVLATMPIRSQRRLLTEGRVAPGLVTRHGNPEHGPHNHKLGRKYYYEFPLLSGAVAQGRAGPVENPPEVGRTIPVLYDPEEPRRNAPYPLPLVRPAHVRNP